MRKPWYDPIVRLQGDFRQHPYRLPIMGHGKGAKSKCCLQLSHMLPPCHIPVAVIVPAFRRLSNLRSNHVEQRRKRRSCAVQVFANRR